MTFGNLCSVFISENYLAFNCNNYLPKTKRHAELK